MPGLAAEQDAVSLVRRVARALNRRVTDIVALLLNHKVTCQLLGVVFEEKTPEELQKHATVRPSVLELLLEISRHCDIYLMETVLDDKSEENALMALESAGLFRTGGLMEEKVLFCSTEVGRTSFVRQLEADFHIDTSLDIVSQLSRFIRCQLFISSMEGGQLAANIFNSPSLEQFFS
ncbi:Peroxisome biogenesis protein 22 [Dichanthelium oligosanthes]|uniref:Peroxisome biogenesis protein 22 n=1 Tax=Dichanthelium oligosanthes TaxID=888268 RepID=A0A1E5VYR3_9POAL|nr:Peroxisome biogenesis protein 22 [Dichanthelium oligosanthes]